MALTTDPLPAVVEAARRGEASAWVTLVGRFEGFAVATALGRGGDLESARDVAQDAFLLAVSRIDELRDPAAFAGWFALLVRTACARRARRVRLPESDEGVLGEVAAYDEGPEAVALKAEQAAEARAAVEALPEPERMVIALRYLADMSYREIAGFAGITEAAARKRAFSARHRLKEVLPVIPEVLANTRPSIRGNLTNTVLLFAAIRHHDHATIARLLESHPELVHEKESWSWDQALELALRNAEDGTPLIRAVEAGDLRAVDMLLAASAPIDGRCACAGAETPLWTAVSLGHREIVEHLLAAGADPNATAFAGATPLHVAAHTHPELMERLITGGADPARLDHRGRIARDWLHLHATPSQSDGDPLMVTSGVRALDLFAPITRGQVQYWPPAVELGQTVLLYELISALAPCEAWWLGFAYGPYDHASLENATRQWGVAGHYRLAPAGITAAAKRETFADALADLTAVEGEKVVILLTAPGFHHDVTVALPALTRDPTVVTSIVLEPLTPRGAAIGNAPPEGYGSQVVLDAVRAQRRLYPAIDPIRTTATSWPNARHENIARKARARLSAYLRLDPGLELPDPRTLPQPEAADQAQQLLRYLAQPFVVYEAFNSVPGQSTPIREMLSTVEKILEGPADSARSTADL